jgi:hypothetical protein
MHDWVTHKEQLIVLCRSQLRTKGAQCLIEQWHCGSGSASLDRRRYRSDFCLMSNVVFISDYKRQRRGRAPAQ